MIPVVFAGCLCILPVMPVAGSAASDPPFTPEVKGLLKQLTDADAAKRLEAIRALGGRSQRVRTTAGTRERIGKEFDPEVPGLVPYLVNAVATDRSAENRAELVIVLADTLDPAAVAAIRKRLEDKSESVRFNAACVLTEFKDASGLDELKKGLARLRKSGDWPAVGVYDVQRLLASFERITGKSLGELPPNPYTNSNAAAAERDLARYRELMATWDAWWNWKPPAK